MMFLVIAAILVCTLSEYASEDNCLDHKGKTILHGERYFPLGSDPCTQCTCSNGKSEMCISVFCSPPENCRQYNTLNDKCCEFVCLDANFPHNYPPGGNGTVGSNDDTLNATNLGLRLVASAFTSFLILALLLFMIHRLRQRRLLLVIRRLNGRLDTQSGSGQQYSLDDETSVGYFVGRDHLDFGTYDEPPPPYSFWKPPNTYIPTGEAPPPYESTERVPNGPQPQSGGDATRSRKEPSPCQRGATGQTSASTSPTCNLEHDEAQLAPPCRESTCIILSDDVYESVPPYQHPSSENVTVLQVKGPSGSFRLCEDDIANGNVLPGVSTEMDRRESDRRRCHSYNEVLEEWRKRCLDSKAPSVVPHHRQRYSVQPVVSGQNNNYFTDPTTWSGEASESSSSSSPGTGSLSSSDSSSVDCLNATTDAPVAKPAPLVLVSVRKPEARSKGKGSSLSNRTLQQIKKLSLVHRKKTKESSEGRPKSEIGPSSNSCLPDNRRNRKTLAAKSELVAGSSKDFQDGRLQGAKVVVVRPKNLNLGLTARPVSQSHSTSPSDNGSSGTRSTSDSEMGAPLPPTVVAIRCSSAARVNHLNTRFSDSMLLDNSERSGIRYVVPSEEDFVFSRSSSVCSETGERRIRCSSVGEALSNENSALAHAAEQKHLSTKSPSARTLETVGNPMDFPQRTRQSGATNMNDCRLSVIRDDTCC